MRSSWVVTNESATCKYATSPGITYSAMPYMFAITGGTSHSVLLTNLTSGNSYNYYVKCSDSAGNADTADYTVSFSIATANATFTPIRVNAGGPAYTDSSGQVWMADTGFTGGSAYNVTHAISSTSTAALYQTERYGDSQYQFNVPNGTYTVNLKFAEIYMSQPGQRVFNVAINGNPVLSQFDIIAQAGTAFTALDKSFTVMANAGTIKIQFTSIINYAKISAIEIMAATGNAIRVNAGGSAYTDPSGNTWSADTGFSGGSPYGVTQAIASTTTAPLYQSERYGDFQYNFNVTNGTHTVTVKFSEIYMSKPGQRVFNVAINGTPVLSNFDIIAQAGAAFTPLDKSFSVTVNTGRITIEFTSVINYAKISAIEID